MAEKESTITTNRRAWFEYEIFQTFEAGIVLTGTEVKSLRQGHVNMSDSYCRVSSPTTAYIQQLHITPYGFGSWTNHDPTRERKLLLHRQELNRLYSTLREKGTTLIPLKMYFKGSLIKVSIGIARGKKLHDKRQTLKDREAKREMDQSIKALKS